MELWPRQLTGVQKIRESIARGNRKILVVSPTGSGKTVTFSHIVNEAAKKYKSSLIAAHRREIIHQTSDKLTAYDCDHGILMAGHQALIMPKVQVASLQTFVSRIVNGKKEPPPANVIVFDEAHRSISASFQKIANFYPGAIILGFTATPCRSDGRGLGGFYDDLIEIATVRQLIDEGYLVEPHVYAPSMPDLSRAKVRAADYAEEDLDRAMNQPALVGNLVKDWLKRAHNRQTIVFASSVAHSRAIRTEFEQAGVRVAHIDGETDSDVRDRILADYHDGKIQVVTNCMVLTEGYDAPATSCIVLARPTKSYSLYLQMIGRGLRIWESKDDCVVIDHAGNVYEHGFPEDAGDWDLDPDVKVQDRRAERLKKAPAQITCRSCWHVYEKRADCPKCGWQPNRREEQVSMTEGRLHQVEKKVRKKSTVTDAERFWNSCLYRCANSNRNLTMNQVRGMFRKKFPSVNPTTFHRSPKSPEEWSLLARNFTRSAA